jgi:hypothetical protein
MKGRPDFAYLWRRASQYRRHAAAALDHLAAQELRHMAELYAAEAMKARLAELLAKRRR